MPDKNWDLFFNELFRDYLRTAGSISAGVPTTAQMPIRTAQDKQAATQPRAVITHERRAETNIYVYDALFTVTAHLLDDDDQGTTATQGEAWLQKIRQRIADKTAVQAYIATLTEEVQADWQPTVLHVMALPFKRDREEGKGELELSFDFTFTVVVEGP